MVHGEVYDASVPDSLMSVCDGSWDPSYGIGVWDMCSVPMAKNNFILSIM